jgi:uncharacterized OB-fold protein
MMSMEIPRHWRLKTQRYRLEGTSCQACSQFTFPPRPVCVGCTTQSKRVTGYEPSSLLTITATPISNSNFFQIVLKGK